MQCENTCPPRIKSFTLFTSNATSNHSSGSTICYSSVPRIRLDVTIHANTVTGYTPIHRHGYWVVKVRPIFSNGKANGDTQGSQSLSFRPFSSRTTNADQFPSSHTQIPTVFPQRHCNSKQKHDAHLTLFLSVITPLLIQSCVPPKRLQIL